MYESKQMFAFFFVLFSTCKSQPENNVPKKGSLLNKATKADSLKRKTPVNIQGFYIDQSEINSNQYKEFRTAKDSLIPVN